ncbi:MAG: hypothetical protein P8123_00720 [bacterium]
MARKINIPFHEVDAHNVIPAWLVSRKQEFAEHTLRRKLHKMLPEFMDDFAPIKKQRLKLTPTAQRVQWNDILKTLQTDRSVPKVA